MSDLLLSMQTLFTGAWKLLSGIMIPGTGFSFAALFVALAMVSIGFRTMSAIFGWSVPGFKADDWNTLTHRESYGGTSARQPRISDGRKNDEF